METQNQDAAHSPAEVPNDPGKMFVGGLSWQTSPGPFMDLGGGVGQAQVSAALKILESDPKVKAVFVNVIAGIVNCANIANGIVAACKENPLKHPMVVRLEGTNSIMGRKILEESGLPIHMINDADLAAQTAVKLANSK